MPIVIRELVIRTTVNDQLGGESAEDSSPVNENDIVAICVEKVMELLSEKTER